jgi:ABC-type glycerol-3-phosphate transport system substrate-binding protein
MAFFAAIQLMNKHLIKLLVVVSTLGFTIVAQGTDRWETLQAINWVENPTNQTTVGRFGELGPYQFRPATWRMHTQKPFRQAIHRDVADEVAVKHYEWIKRTFVQAGVEPNVFNIAMAWNCGAGAVIAGRAPAVSYQYAQRVANLVETLKERAQAEAAEATQETNSFVAEQPDIEVRNEGQVRFRVLQDTPRFVLAGE